MNTFYESTLVEQPMSNRIESKDQDYAVRPLGTFAGTIDKILYRSNGASFHQNRQPKPRRT